MGSVHDKGFDFADLKIDERVSRETISNLEQFVELLRKWNRTHNLVGPKELDHIWKRHVLDSIQLVQFLTKQNSRIIDLGSGAGFPVVILATALKSNPYSFTAVESVSKKCAFLRAVGRELSLELTVLNERIEDVSRETYDYVTSRALASLDQLLEYSQTLLKQDGHCIFLKGKGLEEEIEQARIDWNFEYDIVSSASHTEGRILIVKNLTRRGL